MALSQYEKDQAELERLIAVLEATDPVNANALQDAQQALLDFEGITTFDDLERRALSAVQASATNALAGFATHFAAVTENAESLAATFKAAAKLAQEGEKNLFVSRIAGFLDRASKVIDAGKEAVETLQAAGAAGSASDAIAKIEAVVAAIGDAKTSLKNL